MANLVKRGLGFAALACAACCAVPVVTALGIGGLFAGAGAAIAGWMKSEIACLLLLLASGSAMFLWWRTRRAKPDCETSCHVDGDCCQPSAVSQPQRGDPCSLPLDERADRFSEFRTLFGRAFRSRERVDDTVTWKLAALPGVLEESRRLAALEGVCCSSLHIDVCINDGFVLWTIDGSPSSRDLLQLFYDLPPLSTS